MNMLSRVILTTACFVFISENVDVAYGQTTYAGSIGSDTIVCGDEDIFCFNAGSCAPNGTCMCEPGFSGPFCEYEDPCLSDPCQYGSTCTSVGQTATCHCPQSLKGEYCEYLSAYTSCDENPCDNDGECHEDSPGDVFCICLPFTRGARCDRFTLCVDEEPCLHGGRCVNTGMGSVNYCDCTEAYTGYYCEVPANCGPPNPCRNRGRCDNAICTCVGNWTGPTCEEPGLDACGSIDCQNGGTCDTVATGAYCICPPGYSGAWCEIDESLCQCLNGGTCDDSNLSSMPSCLCPAGYTGQLCEDSLPACSSDPCMNGGMCADNPDGTFDCSCMNGFSGNKCQNAPPAPPPPSGLTSETIGIIAGCVAGAVVIITIVITVACCCHRRNGTPAKEHLALEAGVARPRRRSHDYTPSPTGLLAPAIPNLKLSEARKGQNMEFPRNRLTILTKLGSGSFAEVYKAEAVGIIKADTTSLVAVKMLKALATENDKSDLSKELSLYLFLDPHPNIVNLLGCCTETDPWYIIMEYLSNGNLQGYLRQIRTGQSTAPEYKNVRKQDNIPPNDLLTFSVQIARGMEYLASKACIHRDLAARNILLGEGMVCKVSDFGLARDLEDGQTYEMKSQGRVPVRWMSPESLLHNTYTSQSDVWSFGVLLWEIVTLGSHPYPGLSSKQVVKEISVGYRLPKPDHCSQDIYDIMSDCWKYEPYERPTFTKIKDTLENMLADATGYLDMTDFNGEEYLYLEPDQHSLGTTGESLSHL